LQRRDWGWAQCIKSLPFLLAKSIIFAIQTSYARDNLIC
jgi:hypothetical protein